MDLLVREGMKQPHRLMTELRQLMAQDKTSMNSLFYKGTYSKNTVQAAFNGSRVPDMITIEAIGIAAGYRLVWEKCGNTVEKKTNL